MTCASAAGWARLGFAICILLSASAAAAGSLLAAAALPPNVARDYADAIRTARASAPEGFDFMEELERDMPELDRTRRGRLAPIARFFESMGDAGLWPLVEAAAFDGPRGTGWTRTALRAWQAGLVEALGRRRDARLIPLLDALLANLPQDEVVAREVVVARGLFADDTGTTRLVTMAQAPGPHRTSVLAGLGRCRRIGAAEVLGSALDAAVAEGDDALVRLVVESLADVGNGWVWKRLPGEHPAEANAVRRTAAEALVRAFGRVKGHLRQAVSNALMVVDAPETPALVDAARSKSPGATRSAFDELLGRFARNPAR